MSGTSKRLEALYAEHSPWAARLAYLITQDHELAQDVTQDAFVRVFGRFRDRSTPQEFPAYLRKTIVNLCNDAWRRKRIRRLHNVAPDPDAIAPATDLDARHDLLTALRRLPVRQRSVLVLKHYEALKEREIADLLGCSVGAVKALTTRGLENLRAQVGGMR